MTLAVAPILNHGTMGQTPISPVPGRMNWRTLSPESPAKSGHQSLTAKTSGSVAFAGLPLLTLSDNQYRRIQTAEPGSRPSPAAVAALSPPVHRKPLPTFPQPTRQEYRSWGLSALVNRQRKPGTGWRFVGAADRHRPNAGRGNLTGIVRVTGKHNLCGNRNAPR